MTTRSRGSALAQPRGFALVIVLWSLVLMAAIGTYLLVNARMETAIARNIRAAASAEALADAGIAQAVFSLSDPVDANRWALDGMSHRLDLPGGEVVIRVSDETAKINPNLASEALLTALFAVVGVQEEQARRLAAATADWVGPDGPSRPLGAKLQQYQDAGLSYGPPNAPIESLDELQLVLRMTPEIFSAARPYLTIYTQSGTPTPANAPVVVRRALTLASNERSAGDERAVRANTTNNQPVGEPLDAAQPAGPAPAEAAAKPPAAIVNVEVTARGALGGVFVRAAVLRLEPDNPKGYSVLYWQRGDLAE